MYRVLIVDDELHVVDWVYELLQELDGCELDLYKASTVTAALAMLNRNRMDIVVSDIAMPGMNGLELHARIRELWPSCKVVFLTGHSDFDYAYEAVKNEAAGYVLKTEDDDAIVGAVKRVINTLELELEQRMELQQAQQQAQSAMSALRNDYILALLRGEGSTPQDRRQLFAETGIALDPELPLLVIAARADNGGREQLSAMKGPTLPALGSYVLQSLKERWELCEYVATVDCVIWLCQSERDVTLPISVQTYLKESLERIQNDFNLNLGAMFSFIYAITPAEWDRVAAKREELWQQLLHATMYRSGVLLQEREATRSDELLVTRIVFERSKLELLRGYLDKGEAKSFMLVLEELEHEVGKRTLEVRESGTLELFQSLSMLILSCMNRHRLESLQSDEEVLDKLTQLSRFGSWEEYFRFVEEIASMIFRLFGERYELQGSATIRFVKEYMRSTLHAGFSLVELADQVHFNPSYLSRLFKESTGVSITDYLAELRLARAIELLKENYKVSEIAAAVGIEAPAYFSRFFKKMTKRTPQEYREQWLLSEGHEKSKR
ncbi:response regulator transcription factor [Paenibacillus agaridevorans]|uniref:response regulator transcription factor n=1 Tax=Paenibacillus agaridevorans TaxID=171404 RepID=UPI001BE4436B|nr:response regulator [Paenibacillus agaridevorans]